MEFLKALNVYDVMSPKIRVGNMKGDGGYVLNETILQKSNRLISLGSAQDYSLESDWIKHIPHSLVEIYDGTCGCVGFCQENKQITYIQKNVGNSQNTENLTNILKNRTDVFLKMDIEGGEYFVFDEELILNDVTGISVEFHDVHIEHNREKIIELVNNKFSNFILFHLHANNYTGTFKLYDYDIPKTMELSFINKKFIEDYKLDNNQYPINGLDVPNNNIVPDIPLKWINKFEK